VTMSTATLPAPIPVAQEPGAVPEWVMLARTGAWFGHPTAQQVIEPRHLASALDYFRRHYAAHGTDLVIDYHHASMAVPMAKAPAAGWVREMELRNGGTELWGRVLWTTEAAGAIARREYRYLSPVFRFDRPDRLTGEPVPLQIHSVALTNTPFLTELESLNEAVAEGPRTGDAKESPSEGGIEMPILDSLAAALEAEPAELAARLGLEPDADDRTVAEAVMANADAGRRGEAECLVDGAVREGRIPPAHRGFYLREALTDLDAAREVINSLPVLTAPQPAPPHRPAAALTEGEEAVRRQLGLTPEQMIAARSD